MVKDKVEVYFCPKCESVKVGYVFRLGNLFGVLPKMECRDCGFSAAGFPILVVDRKKGKKVSKKKVKKLEDKMLKDNLVKGSGAVVCPKCRSKSIKPKMRWRGDTNMECQECGYENETFLVAKNKVAKKKVVKKVKKAKKAVKKK